MIWKNLTRLFRPETNPLAHHHAQTRLLTLAQQQLAAGALNDAATSFRQVLALTPGHIDTLCALGAITSEQGHIAEALEIATRLGQLEPDNPDHPLRAAVFQSQLGHRDQACRLSLHALDLRENNIQAHALLSTLEMPGENYMELLARLHRHLQPRSYIEIGVFEGEAIVLANPKTVVIGVDPQPQIKVALGANTHIHTQTSDDYFSRHDVRAELGGLPVDMAFIDGMHHFEFALRDFINIERLCARESVIFIHDCFPLNRATAERQRKTLFWSGDIWRLLLLLCKYRPDLEIRTIATRPTGLALITRLDPDSRVLPDALDALIAEYLALDYAVLDHDKDAILNRFPNDWEKIRACLPVPFSASAF